VVEVVDRIRVLYECQTVSTVFGETVTFFCIALLALPLCYCYVVSADYAFVYLENI